MKANRNIKCPIVFHSYFYDSLIKYFRKSSCCNYVLCFELLCARVILTTPTSSNWAAVQALCHIASDMFQEKKKGPAALNATPVFLPLYTR